MRVQRKSLLVGLIAVAVIAAAGYGWWRVDLRYRPRTLDAHEAQIAAMLEQAGWVSPGLSNDKVIYLIGFRSCPDCIQFETEEFPRLQAAGVDTRVILFPRRSTSTPEERAGVGELWANRSWKTFQTWMAAPPAAWTAEGIRSDLMADRAALVEKSRKLVEAMEPLLADNGIRMAFPTLVWRDDKGRLRGCACEKAATYRFVRKELGVT